MKKMFLAASLIFLCPVLFISRLHSSIRARDLCDVEGYTIVDCTYTQSRYRNETEPDDIIKLENGMVFHIIGYRFPQISSSRAIVFAIKSNIKSNEVFYKLFIDDEDAFYDVIRIQ